jgi:hypothetical protein
VRPDDHCAGKKGQDSATTGSHDFVILGVFSRRECVAGGLDTWVLIGSCSAAHRDGHVSCFAETGRIALVENISRGTASERGLLEREQVTHIQECQLSRSWLLTGCPLSLSGKVLIWLTEQAMNLLRATRPGSFLHEQKSSTSGRNHLRYRELGASCHP